MKEKGHFIACRDCARRDAPRCRKTCAEWASEHIRYEMLKKKIRKKRDAEHEATTVSIDGINRALKRKR